MNIILVVLDSFRYDHLGACGNDWIHTPHLDSFAAEAVRFTQGYPESLPTLPVRRALHTGRRVFPFENHVDKKGGFIGAPGWGPIEEDRDTVAEILSEKGWRTAFFTDTYHQFKPSMNFHRGFDEWRWIRGQEADPYISGLKPTRDDIEKHLTPDLPRRKAVAEFLDHYLRNNAERRREEDYYPARLFTEASRWVWENTDADPFFLVVDSFDPHEPWDPPQHYRRMYDPDEDGVKDIIHSPYAHWQDAVTPRELKRIQANYAGEVTLVDRWFGFFLETLQTRGLMDNTVIGIISDHGHNVGHDPGDKSWIAKGGHPMTEAVAKLVYLIRHPNGEGAGTTCNELVYNHDMTTTLLSLAGVTPTTEMDGIDAWPCVVGGSEGRKWVTIAWGALMTVIDERWWYNATIYGGNALLYDRVNDPDHLNNIAKDNPDVCEMMRQRAVTDAGGDIPPQFAEFQHRAGCTPLPVD
jgi:arylsulfatase A-like enzyme